MLDGEKPNSAILDVINSVQPKGQTQTDVDSINNYVPANLTPDQMQAYQSQFTPSTGALPVNAYYPDINHNVGVGGYSGSEIGSTTLFAPGGGIVPLGMLDARDAAVQHAAMRKHKEEEDFRKQFQSPTTKHVAVQKDLSDAYNSGLQQWNQNALKKAGGDQALANRMLAQDNNFRSWNKSFQDTAKFQDALVDKYAEFQKDMKNPNVVVSPETQRLGNELMNGHAYLGGDPFNKEGHNQGAKFLGFSTSYDLDKSVNTAIDKAIPTIEQLPPTFQNRGKNEIATYLEKQYFTPEAKKELAHNIYMEKYQGTGITEEQVQKNVDAKLGEKIDRKMSTYDKYFKPDKVEPDYSNITETTARFNVGSGNNQVGEAHLQSFIPLTAAHEKQEISFPINKGTKDLGDPELQNQTGSFKGTVSGVGVAYRDRTTGKISTLTPEEVAAQKENKTFNHNLEAIPVALVNKKGIVAPLPAAQLKQLQEPIQVDDGEGGTREETEQEKQQRVNGIIAKHTSDQESKLNKLVPVPIEQVEGKYPKKTGQKVSFDDKIKEVRQKATTENDQAAEAAKNYREELKNDPEKLKAYKEKLLDTRKSDEKATPVKKSIKQSDISLKAKASGYSEKEYTKLLQDKGIEIIK